LIPCYKRICCDFSTTRSTIWTRKFRPRGSTAVADHVVLALKQRHALARMNYDFERGRELMEKAGLITIALVTAENPQLFHVRNAFCHGRRG